MIENTIHTIRRVSSKRMFLESNFVIHEFCEIVGFKEEVKHPTFKKAILKLYNI